MPERRIASVLMLDVVGSTHVAAELGDARYRELSSRFDRIVRGALRRFGGREEDHAGDGFFATFTQPDRAIRCAASIAEGVRPLGIEIRSGVHTGQTESREGKTQGIAVVIGARVMSLAGPGEVLVTSTTKELATGSDFRFEDLSAHELKGVPGTWQVFALTAVDGRERDQPLTAADAAARRAAILPTYRRPRRAALVAGLVAGAVAVAIVVLMLGRSEPPAPGQEPSAGPRSRSVLQLDPATGEPLTSIDAFTPMPAGFLGAAPPVSNHALVVGQGGAWIARVPNFLVHVDPRLGEVRSRLVIGSKGFFSINVAEGADAIWASNPSGLTRVNPATDEQRQIVQLSEELTTVDVTAGEGAIWMGIGTGSIVRLDPATGSHRWFRGLDPIDEITVGHGSVWTIDVLGSTVTRYDPETMRSRATIPVTGGVDAIVVGEQVWILSRTLGSLTELDPTTNELGHAVQVGDAPTVMTAGLGAIWVADRDGSIRRVDEATRQVTPLALGAEARALAFDDETDTLWVDIV